MIYLNGKLIIFLIFDISEWNTKNVIKMNSLFHNCSSLRSLPDISKWNTNNVDEIGYIFVNCSLITNIFT